MWGKSSQLPGPLGSGVASRGPDHLSESKYPSREEVTEVGGRKRTVSREGAEGFPGGASGKEPVCQCRRRKRLGFDPWVGKAPWRRKRQPTPVSSPGESRGRGAWRAAAHGAAESDATEQLSRRTHMEWQHCCSLARTWGSQGVPST